MEKVTLKVTVNSSKFRQPAIHFQKHGMYTFAPAGTTEYLKHWTREADYCINGFTADDGDFIPGYYYFYLNYFPINLVKEIEVLDARGNLSKRQLKDRDFPNFYDYDRFFFEAVAEAEKVGRHLAVLKSRRKGYEQPISEYVLTPNGKIKMGELKVGDAVINPSGDYSEILEIVPQGRKEVYEVELTDGRKVTCGKDHLWATAEYGKKYLIMPTSQYYKKRKKVGTKGKEYYKYFLPEVNEIPFSKKHFIIPPYTMGALIGDGTLCSHNLNFTSADFEIVQNIKNELPSNLDIKKTLSSEYSYSITTSDRCNTYLREIKSVGLNVTSQFKFIPLQYMYSSIEDRYELVRGLMDTDGTINKAGSARFTSSSEELIDNLATVLRSLGIRCKKGKTNLGGTLSRFNNGHASIVKDSWILTITTQKEIFKLKRKADLIRTDRKYNYSRIAIKSIRKLGRKELQQCIVVDNPNSLYLTGDFIPTHNSYKVASMLDRNFYFFKESKNFALAAEAEFLTKDGILNKAWDGMDFVDQHTAWYKKRQRMDQKMHKRASFLMKDTSGVQIEMGYKSEIMGITLKNDAQKARGKAGKLIIFEEAGKFPNLLQAWQIARPSVEQGSFVFGTMIAFGTGGTEGADFESLKELFEKPIAYGCLEFDNIWDPDAQGQRCGFFIPQYANLEGIYNNPGDPEHGKPFMDSDGNTNEVLARRHILEQRQKVIDNASDKRAIDRHIAEQPITPAEATLNISTNIFPKADLQRHLAYIRNNESIRNFKQVGDLYFDPSGKVKWQQTEKNSHKDIIKYKLDKGDDPTGQIVIWEHPMDEPPYGMYISGCDPYDHDKSGTNSLGSMFIYKRFQTFEKYSETLVAEYTGRPETANDYYENVRKLLLYYNATLLYENEKKGLFFYFERNHCTYLLADQPGDLLRDIVKDSSVDRKKGIHMNTAIKDWGEGAIKDWLVEEYEPGKKNLTKIFSEALLEELISYNDTGNFDRVMAYMMVMLYRQQLHHVHVKKKKELARKNLLFPEPIFTGEMMHRRTF